MNERILFVDDEQPFLHGLRRRLRSLCPTWETQLAGSADQALDMIGASPPDVVVLDIAMPGKDGFELLKVLRASDKTRDIPVAMMTGAHESGLKRRALDLGATDLLSKPVATEDLVARIRSLLRLKAYQDEIKHHNRDLERRVEERTLELHRSHVDVIWRLAKAGEYRDKGTGRHVVRVSAYCRVLAKRLGLPQAFVDNVVLTSPLHDIGKIAVPDGILLKAGRLTLDEMAMMQQHCVIGAGLLSSVPLHKTPSATLAVLCSPTGICSTDNELLTTAAKIALTHHERWDGSGYPIGLVGEQIPLESRLVAIADVYDALRSSRPYKPQFSKEEALEVLLADATRLFDPFVFAAFEESVTEFESIMAELGDSELLMWEAA